MQALFRIRVLAVCGTRLWCAGTGPVTAGISQAVHDELTELCAGMSVIGLDLRELRLPTEVFLPSAPWPDGPDAVHLLAPERLRSVVADDERVHWHSDLRAAWAAWSDLSA
ncbi:hypothetical protein ACFCYF_16895 [Streptomyces chartreusis]|uniref:hypothetical protein n=1 Tax=Streptomyces TaxID=1883 RepID=UPI002E7FF935|nr:hypothetical protein [Streptomyces chartreusis]WUB23080.1 hypothetical protein OG997_43115 [Streptomyces chartreusis]